MIPKSGNRFSEKIVLKRKGHDPEKWKPVFGQDHAQTHDREKVKQTDGIPRADVVE
jgi:hypothetical protein